MDERKKIDKRILKTKRLIRTTFLELLTRKEFHKITVTEIANNAEIDRKTFYLHYANTQVLLEEFEQELLDKATDKLNSSESFDIRLLFETFNEIFMENSVFFEQVIAKRINIFFLNKCNDIIVSLLKEKIYKGKVEPFSKEFYHLKYIASGLITLYVEWVNSEERMSIQALSEMAIGIVKVNFEQLNVSIDW